MKRNAIVLRMVVFTGLLVAVTGILALRPVSAVRLTKAKPPVALNTNAIFYHNTLFINSKPLDYASFSIASQGVLTMLTGMSKAGKTGNIPFRIYLSRNGIILNQGASDNTRSVLAVDVASVLALAKSGDDLVIEPARKGDPSAKRSIRLSNCRFNATLFPFLKRGKDGC